MGGAVKNTYSDIKLATNRTLVEVQRTAGTPFTLFNKIGYKKVYQ